MGFLDTIVGKILPSNRTEAAQGIPASLAARDTAPDSAASFDVEAEIAAMADKKGQSLNWRTSIVDLLKVLDLDSSLQARQGLARELGYPGDMNDSAKMNVWLQERVMGKLAENGGKVPADLKH